MHVLIICAGELLWVTIATCVIWEVQYMGGTMNRQPLLRWLCIESPKRNKLNILRLQFNEFLAEQHSFEYNSAEDEINDSVKEKWMDIMWRGRMTSRICYENFAEMSRIEYLYSIRNTEHTNHLRWLEPATFARLHRTDGSNKIYSSMIWLYRQYP